LVILSVKKEAKLSASELAEVKEGKDDEDSWCNSLLTVFTARQHSLLCRALY